jgi:hypothetical protein
MMYIDSSHHDTLSYEWHLVHRSDLIVCLVYCCAFEELEMDMVMIILSF